MKISRENARRFVFVSCYRVLAASCVFNCMYTYKIYRDVVAVVKSWRFTSHSIHHVQKKTATYVFLYNS